MRILAFLLALLLAVPALAEMYRWKDAQGNVVFGDSPPEGVSAEPVKVRPNVVETPKLPEPPPPAPAPEGPAGPAYQALRITEPADQSAVRENAGNVTITLGIEPDLNVRVGHKLQVLMDGAPVAEGQTLQFMLTNVDRGTHSLSARVLDAQGNELVSSPTISFTLLRYSSLQGTPRPAPTPRSN